MALVGLLSALLLGLPQPVRAGPTSGTLYYSTYQDVRGDRIHSIDFNYNGSSSLSLMNKTDIAALPGADGLVFTSDSKLAVGGQGNAVYRVDPTTGATLASPNAGGTSAYHMMVGPDGSIYSSGIPGTPAKYNSTLTNNGAAGTVTGSEANIGIDTIAWDSTGQAWYTSSGSGGNGSFGRLTITGNTYATTRLQSNVAAAHGMTFDAYTGTLILFGNSHITQIDPNNPTVILHDVSFSNVQFDQGTVDGQGHIFVADNNGNLLFMDISGSKNVAAANFTSLTPLDSFLDDVAPLSGLGSAAPEPSTLALLATGGLGLLGYARRRRKRLA
jgi:hypothetical protein